MREIWVLLGHFLTTLARLLGPGGMRAVIAETLVIKHQLVILYRSRRRAVPPFDLIRATNGFFAAAGDALFTAKEARCFVWTPFA